MTQERQLAWVLVLLFVVNIAAISLAQQVGAAIYRQGSGGEQVRIVQTKLKNWGYYDDTVDGIYGNQTAQAARCFQRKNDLIADDTAGPTTSKALGISSNDGRSSSQWNSAALLARVVSAEARGEPYNGQVAMGTVILSRVEYPSFPNTIAEVVYQPGVFAYMADGQSSGPVADSAYQAVQDAFSEADPSGGTIYYSDPNTATSAQIWSRPLIKTTGRHRSCT